MYLVYRVGYDKAAKQLRITTCANQDPLEATTGLVPLLGIDVWEHAYYLQVWYICECDTITTYTTIPTYHMADMPFMCNILYDSTRMSDLTMSMVSGKLSIGKTSRQDCRKQRVPNHEW